MDKFKVGDRVKCERFGVGTIIFNDKGHSKPILVEFDKENKALHDGENFRGAKGKDNHCFWFEEEELQLEKKEIHIYVNDRITTAIVKENGKVIKKAEARCNPIDEFNFESGAKLAFDRLFKEKIKVGDMIKVTDSYQQYKDYYSWFKESKNRKLSSHFIKGADLDKSVVYRVVAIGKHDSCKDITILAIQNPNTTQVFLIGEEGVEKI